MMKFYRHRWILLAFVLSIGVGFFSLESGRTTAEDAPLEIDGTKIQNSFLVKHGYSAQEVEQRLKDTWNQLFYGDDDTERIYYPVEDDTAYILDVDNNDVRSEGMSYGMMIAVQLDRKAEFDRLWKWAKTHMYHADGQWAGYFAWHCRSDGTQIDAGPAPDGEEWFVTALFFASARWGDGEGIFNYRQEANNILDAMLLNDREGSLATSMFHPQHHMVVFVPQTDEYGNFTDPSYHLPHYYELWAQWADDNNKYWKEAAKVSREFWKITAHPTTGLMPNYAEFTGEPRPSDNYGEFFYADAWRNGMTVAMDYLWFAPDQWHIEQSNRLLNFFYDLGINQYNSKFLVDGTPVEPQHRTAGLISMNAVAAMVATTETAPEFIKAFWNTPIPSGPYRYYDGLLYTFALLNLSGHFNIYAPQS